MSRYRIVENGDRIGYRYARWHERNGGIFAIVMGVMLLCVAAGYLFGDIVD